MRQPTPNILDALLPTTPTFPPAPAPAPALRYDYASLGSAGPAIADHARAIKVAEQRTAEATVEAGSHLIAVKETIPHGHWLDWLANEFGMSDDAAQRMMSIARRFGSNTATLRYLTPSVLALLSPESVPDAAVDAAIAAAAASPVTVTAAKAIIAQHKAAGRCRKCGRTLTDPAAAANGIGACCAARLARGAAQAEAQAEAQTEAATVGNDASVLGLPVPAWASNADTARDLSARESLTHSRWPATAPADDATVPVAPDFAPIPPPPATANETPAPQPAPPRNDSVVVGMDGRTEALGRLEMRLGDLIGVVGAMAREYGDRTGDHGTPLEVRHGLEKMLKTVRRNMGEGWE